MSNSHEATLQIRNTLTAEGVALIQVQIDTTIINLDASAAVQLALSMLGAAYQARAEEAIYKATLSSDQLKKAITHLRSIK